MAEIVYPVEPGKDVEVVCEIKGKVTFSDDEVIKVRLTEHPTIQLTIHRKTIKSLQIKHYKDAIDNTSTTRTNLNSKEWNNYFGCSSCSRGFNTNNFPAHFKNQTGI